MFLYKPPLNAINRDRASSVTETDDEKNEIQSSCLSFGNRALFEENHEKDSCRGQ